jgi:glycosyltransferase involved in cell wall biosynthesis
LPKIAKNNQADIVHATYVGPIFSQAKLVLMVHDFAFKRYPEFFSFKEKIIFRFFLPISMKRAAAIVVPTEFTKKELIHYYPEHAKKVFVTLEASSPEFKSVNKKTAINRLKRKYRIKSPYLLAFNGKHDKRNINRVVSAFEQIKDELPDLNLVILGGDHHIKNRLDKRRVKILKGITDQDLNYLYNAAEIVIYFSLYEGFGLPVLEASSCKTPVIASDIPAIKEVVGKSTFLINPKEDKLLAKTILKLMRDKKLHNKMSERGYKLAKEYSWSKTAETTIKAYNFALKQK